MGLASTEFSGSSADFSSGLCDASSSMVLGGLLDLWAFQGSAKTCIKHLEHGKVTVPLEGGSLMPIYAKCHRDHLAQGNRFQYKRGNIPHDHQE